MTYLNFCELKGKTIASVQHNDDEVVFTTTEDERYHLWHSQDCCESVQLDRISGDLSGIIGKPIVFADEQPGHGEPAGYESVTFSDFVVETETHSVTFHFIGSSNGYYNESVYFTKLDS